MMIHCCASERFYNVYEKKILIMFAAWGSAKKKNCEIAFEITLKCEPHLERKRGSTTDESHRNTLFRMTGCHRT